jgi:hypothetical protein
MQFRECSVHRGRVMVAMTAMVCIGWAVPVGVARGQQVQVSTPMNGVSDSFYEQIGSNWGFHSGGGFFNFGGANPGVPPLGGFNPNAGAQFGFGGRTGGGGFFFNGFAGQGSSRSIVSETPTVVIPNGGVGSIANVLQRPFVTGLVPVVGSRDASPLLERLERLRQEGRSPRTVSPRTAPGDHVSDGEPEGPAADVLPVAASQNTPLESTASRGDLSVAEIRRQQQASQLADDARRQAEIEQLVERARGCELQGKPAVARIYLQQAARKAEGSQREQLLARIRQLQR